MILADTNIWGEFLRNRPTERADLFSRYLSDKRVVCHDWIVGELMVANLGTNRKNILDGLRILPKTRTYPVTILEDFIERERLYGRGLSLVDAQLLYAAIAEDHELWTADKTLRHFAKRYGVAFTA